jgi:hypothetical protein
MKLLFLSVVHHCVIHPLIPVTEVLQLFGVKGPHVVVNALHDRSAIAMDKML